MPRKIILISGGPQQLIALIALMHQLQKMHEVAGVLSYVGGDDRLVSFERLVCELFKLDYRGTIEGLKEKIVEVGFGSMKRAIDTLLHRNLIRKIQSWFEEEGVWTLFEGATVAMPYRQNLTADNLLLNVISPKEVLLVPDGVYLAINSNLLKRVTSRLLGIKDFCKVMHCKLYLTDYLERTEDLRFEYSTLSRTYLKSAYDVVRLQVRRHVEKVCVDMLSKPIFLLLWQNLFPKFFSNKKQFLDFFGKVVYAELENGATHLVVKPHPRSKILEIEELKSALPIAQKQKVTILEDDLLVACPAEVFCGLFNIRRVAGIASTGVLSLSQEPYIDVNLYSSRNFPKRLQSEIKRVSCLIGLEIVEL